MQVGNDRAACRRLNSTARTASGCAAGQRVRPAGPAAGASLCDTRQLGAQGGHHRVVAMGIVVPGRAIDGGTGDKRIGAGTGDFGDVADLDAAIGLQADVGARWPDDSTSRRARRHAACQASPE